MTKPLNIRVSEELKIKVQRSAARCHRTMTGYIKHVLEEATSKTLEAKESDN